MVNKSGRLKYLVKNTLVFALGNLGSRLVTFLLVPVYTAVLLPAEYGVTDLLYTICTVLGPVITLNLSDGVMRFCLDKDAKPKKILFLSSLAILFSSIIGLCIIPLSELFASSRGYGITIYLCSLTMGLAQVYLAYLRGIEKPLLYSIGCILQTLMIALLSILFLCLFRWGISGYFRAYIYANLLTMLYCFVAGKMGFPSIKAINLRSSRTKHEMWDLLKYSAALIPNTLMWWIMNASDRVMVTAFLGAAANGIYSVSYKIPGLVSTCNTIFNQAWSYSAIKEANAKDRLNFTNRVFENLVLFVTITSIGILIVLKPLMHIYVSSDYYEAWKCSPILLLGNSFLILGSFVASTTYTVGKNSVGMLKSGLWGAIPNIIINFILIPLWGIYGAAIATCISYIIIYIYRLADTKKDLPIAWNSKLCRISYTVLLISTVTVYLPGIWSYICLSLEALFIIIFFRKIYKELFYKMFNLFKGKRSA